jgi:hypothetical protein
MYSDHPFIDRLLPAPVEGGFRMPDYWVWCGSVIQDEDDRYHMFAARWPKATPFFDGYRVASEIVRAVADTPTGPYTFAEVVLPDRGAGFWDGRMTHNPTIHRYGDQFLLFYIGATYPGPRPTPADLHAGTTPVPDAAYATIRIGMATAPSVHGPWTRPDAPVLTIRPGKWDSSIVTNPAVCIRPNGAILLYYRSNYRKQCRIGVARADHLGAPFERLYDDPIFDFGPDESIEDPFVWHNGGHFELIAKDLGGGITGEKHAGVHATSSDAVHWTLSDPPKAYSRRVTWDDGATTVQGSLERPQLLFEDGEPRYLFAATADGPGGFRAANNTWNMVIPIKRVSE